MDWLDYARFFSALCVVFFHYFFNGVANGKIASYGAYPVFGEIAKYGYLGVNFFFLISGFVIALSMQKRSTGPFVVSRFLRLWPAFFLCMTITATIRILSQDPDFAVSLSQYLANLTVMPQIFGHANIDGVYWTLTYEITFYSMIACTIFLRIPLSNILLPWLLGIVAAKALGLTGLPLIGTHYAWFLAGCTIFLITREPGIRWRYLVLFAAAALALYEVCMAADGLTARRGTPYSAWVIGVSSGVFIALFLGATLSEINRLKLPFARSLGLATYPLYLLHAYIGYIVLSYLGTEENKLILTLVLIVVMIAASVVVVYAWEKPTASFFRAIADRCIGKPLALLEAHVGTRIQALADRMRNPGAASRDMVGPRK
ncbi:acyltransferase [Sulfitobacter sp. F26169L]|uniref:acyltransferase family protein n=1 Tax=Sulfitobacter sp. F26169L TaxID=2996015 RepID=UPI002261032F|nr:acyltransferase [Sulfitobacter sp. F26169L]MCX7568270.1 acyltransferase [Sulfitobacter sp. F26169L]